MKKQYKIVSFLLVLSLLFGSLIFTVNADTAAQATGDNELRDGFTYVATKSSSDVLNAIKYDKPDNLITYLTLQSGATNGWGSADARQSYIYTDSTTGDVFYLETSDGSLTGENEYVNYNFQAVTLGYTQGYSEYIIVEYDASHEAKSGTYIKGGSTLNSEHLKQQLIARGSSAGTSWGNNVNQFYKDFIPASSFVHYTTVYDFTSGSAFIFVNGMLTAEHTYNALSSGALAKYLAGESSIKVGEFRVGSNSCDDLYVDNVYVRHEKNADSSDTLGAAIASGRLEDWNNNIYDSSYELPRLPYFKENAVVTPLPNNSGTLTNSTKSMVSGNTATGISTSNATDSPFLTVAEMKNVANPYTLVYCNTDTNYQGTSNNLFISLSMNNSAPFTVIGDDVTAMYVIDMDVATHGNMLPGFDISVPMRRNSDKSGYPFSDEIYVGNYLTNGDEWVHVTIIGDVKNNVAKVYVNGVFMGDAGQAVRTGQLNSDTQVVAQGLRIELTRNNILTNMDKGDNVAFDNLSYRLFADGDASLSAAIASNDLNNWDKNTLGRSGEKLAAVATVNGTTYYNENTLANALTSNNTLEVEFLHKPISPVTLRASATVNTNGMDIDTLVEFGPDCSEPKVSGNKYTVTHPYMTNRIDELYTFTASTVSDKLYTSIRGNAVNNIFKELNYVTNGSINKLGTPGFRSVTLVTNPFTGETMLRESITPNADGGLDYANEYMNFKTNRLTLSYESGKTEYVVVDMDYAYEGVLDNLMFQLIPRNAGSGRWASDLYHKNLNLTAGEMVHLTLVYDLTNNNNHVYINGKFFTTVSTGAMNSTGHSEYKSGTTLSLEELKMGSNSTSTVYIDNMNIRFFDLATANDTLDDAIASGNIQDWSDNIYTSDYVTAQLPAIASVNGTECHTYGDIETALHANPGAEVNLLHSSNLNLNFAMSADIKTNGFTSNITANGGIITDRGDVIKVAFDNMSSVVTKDTTAIRDAIKYNANDNRFNAFAIATNNAEGWNTEGTRKSTLISNLDDGNTYYREEAYGSKITATNEYIHTNFQSVTLNYQAGTTEYIVMDYDFIYESLGMGLDTYIIARGGSATSFGARQGYNTWTMLNKGEFNHVTVAYNFTTGYSHVFINGIFAFSVAGGALASAQLTEYKNKTKTITTSEIRTGSNTTSIFHMDNVYIRHVRYNDSQDTLAAAVSSGSIHTWSANIYDLNYKMPEAPALATVNGTPYYTEEALEKAVSGDKSYEIEFFRTPTYAITVKGEAVIETNGFQNCVATGLGYNATDDLGLITITIDATTGHVLITINGIVLFDGDLRVGTNIQEFLEGYGSHGTSVVACNGNIFTNVSWNVTPDVLTGDTDYVGTGTQQNGLFVVVNNSGAITSVGNTASELRSAIYEGTSNSIILNGNADIEGDNSFKAVQKNVYLNGYTLSYSCTDKSKHPNAGGGGQSLAFYGPGTINDTNSDNTTTFMFGGYDWTGTLSLNNLTLNASESLAQLRGGNLEINNCEIYALTHYNGSLIQIGEDYNGNYSKAAVHIDIVDSYINYRTASASTVPMFSQKVVTANTDPKHVLNITGSTLVAESYLFKASDVNADNGVDNPQSNLTINVSDSALVATNLTHNDYGFTATLNFVNNVSVNSNMGHISDATLAQGLKIAKSNNHLADVTYTSKYATVNWANGTQDLWVNGSTPVNASVPFTAVSEVKAGKSYTFGNVYGEAPFALKGNLTLGSAIHFNFYIPIDSAVDTVVVNGKTLAAEEKSIDGELYLCYTVELTPAEAVSAFDIFFNLTDGNTVARTMSVAQYATLVYNTYGDATTLDMMSNTLNYIKSSAKYFGINANVSAIDALLAQHAPTTQSVPASSANPSTLSAYISGAQLNVLSTLKFRFNLTNGTNGNDVKITVNGEAKDVEVHVGYVEVELRAYEMGDMMTITVDGVTGTFDLAYYCSYVIANASSTGSRTARLYSALTNSNKGNLVSAIYSYYVAASAYNA